MAALCEKLDATPAARVLVVGATSRTDAIDAALVAPGRLDHLVEIALPEPDAQREILELIQARTERNAGRTLFEPIDYRKLLPVMGGHERRRYLGDHPARPGGQGASRRRGRGARPGHHARTCSSRSTPTRACAAWSRRSATVSTSDPIPAAMISTAKVRVRYKDTDCMKVVYYGNYLTYFEVGRVEFLRQQGLPMSDVDRKVHLPVVEATVRYVRPARLDDLLDVRCWVSERRRASFRFAYEIRNEAGERGGHRVHAARLLGSGHQQDDRGAAVARRHHAGRRSRA